MASSSGGGASWEHVPPTVEAWYELGIAEGERRAAERPRERRADGERSPSTADLRVIRGGAA